MSRLAVIALFSLLLVGAQREAFVHDVEHLRARVAQGHDVVAQNATPAECAQCALLAAGGTPVAPALYAFVAQAADGARAPAAREAVRVAARPVPYASRAPPVLL